MRPGHQVLAAPLREPGRAGASGALSGISAETTRTSGKPITVRRGLITLELRHRGEQIRRNLQKRAGYRRRRRSKNLRHRAPRYNNRTRPRGWLAPSLRHRVDTPLSVVRRLRRLAPVIDTDIEQVAFDTHAMSVGRPLTGAEYRRGTLAGTEIREYLLAAWSRACAYCGATGVPLNIDHIRPRSDGGSSRISNLTLACVSCNQAKGAHPVEVFLADRPDLLTLIRGRAEAPLRDAAAMNTTRLQLTDALSRLGPVHAWSGGRTKWNRTAVGLPKSHTLDALAVGCLDHERGDTIVRVPTSVQVVRAMGRGTYARTTPDRFGFPRLRRTRTKRHHGYASGDLVRAVVPSGRWEGAWVGRIAVRASGQHRLNAPTAGFSVSHRHLRLLQRGDGYAWSTKGEIRLAHEAVGDTRYAAVNSVDPGRRGS
ncbi:RNA-guided endonuclease IscB [Streptomyces sp. NBC_01089]|uniref:RNA-guided endonuclease IscB n=1 Tax=Streptomyces sp. NBC_01089 TaxID=2903747 RepID=UPI0038679255